MLVSALKVFLDATVIITSASNVNRVFKATGGSRTPLQNIGGIIFGAACGAWAAGRLNNVMDELEKCVTEIKDEIKNVVNTVDENTTEDNSFDTTAQEKIKVTDAEGHEYYIYKEVTVNG